MESGRVRGRCEDQVQPLYEDEIRSSRETKESAENPDEADPKPPRR